MSSRDDLRNFPGASWLRARSGHSCSPVGHRNFLAVDDGAVRFALHAVTLDVRHDAHLAGVGPDIERFRSSFVKNGKFHAKRRGSKPNICRKWGLLRHAAYKNVPLRYILAHYPQASEHQGLVIVA